MSKGLWMVWVASLVGSFLVSSPSTAQELGTSCVAPGPRVALTFDDGPWAEHTPKILAILEQHQAKATFFVVGQHVRSHPEILRQVAAQGHEIGLHTDSHPFLPKLSAEAQNGQIRRNYDAVMTAVPGLHVRYWRAPYGAVPKPLPPIIGELELKHQAWSMDTEDWRNPFEDVFFHNVFGRLKNKGVILMHEHTRDTQTFLPLLIDRLKEAGYRFTTVSELSLPDCLEPVEEPIQIHHTSDLILNP